MTTDIEDSRSARFALRCSSFAERWFPDSWVFAALAVLVVALATQLIGATPTAAAMAFGDGFGIKLQNPWPSATDSGA